MSYRIERVLNNNAVISKDEQGNEICITGTGIAFNKKYGGYISKDKIQKVFVLDQSKDNTRLLNLLKDIPAMYFDITESIVQYFEKATGKILNERIIITLTDHLYEAIDRLDKGILFHNQLLWEIKELYKQEFEAGEYAIEVVKENLNIELSEDEAGFIALHIVNAEAEYMDTNIKEMTAIAKDILRIIELSFKKNIDKGTRDYQRLLSHIKFFVNRVVNHKLVDLECNEELLEMLIRSYPESEHCINRINDYMIMNKKYKLTDSEKLYLIIHISKIYY